MAGHPTEVSLLSDVSLIGTVSISLTKTKTILICLIFVKSIKCIDLILSNKIMSGKTFFLILVSAVILFQPLVQS